ncbi:hypothetical protein B296_00034716 [Ensete ventricosum]|uniref:Uncharacterized protein n=1 Tax=Ensete ventricosum TaxID=4639 RepID=A0A426YV39_ENSVE|nr:hypothetical protein B296_00034716 [Ensete ventricosum]
MLIITCLPSLFLVISGSSRQFVGFSREMDESIVKRIWDRAGEFFPALKSLGNKIDKIRVGHRPYTFCVETVTAAVDGEEMPRGEAAVVREQLRGSAAPHCFDDHHHHVSQPHGGDPHRQARLLRRASHDHPQTEEEGDDDDDDDTTPIHVGLETAGCGPVCASPPTSQSLRHRAELVQMSVDLGVGWGVLMLEWRSPGEEEVVLLGPAVGSCKEVGSGRFPT